jgi:hypothetical protein
MKVIKDYGIVEKLMKMTSSSDVAQGGAKEQVHNMDVPTFESITDSDEDHTPLPTYRATMDELSRLGLISSDSELDDYDELYKGGQTERYFKLKKS